MIAMGYKGTTNHYADSQEFWLENIKSVYVYPKQPTSHHSLLDAKWNKQLHEFIERFVDR